MRKTSCVAIFALVLCVPGQAAAGRKQIARAVSRSLYYHHASSTPLAPGACDCAIVPCDAPADAIIICGASGRGPDGDISNSIKFSGIEPVRASDKTLECQACGCNQDTTVTITIGATVGCLSVR